MQLGKICNHNNVIHNAFQNYNLLAKQYQIMIQITAVHCLIPALLSWLKNVSKKLHSPLLVSRFYIPFSLILTFSIFYCVLENTISIWWFVFPQSFLWADGTQVKTNHFVLLLSSKALSHLGFVLEELKRRPALFVGFLPWNICYRRNSS